MHRKLICLISLVLLLSLVNIAPAPVWGPDWDNGASTADWNTGANWSTGFVPVNYNPTTATENPLVLAGSNYNGNYPSITGMTGADISGIVVGYEEFNFETATLTIDNSTLNLTYDLSIGYDREEVDFGASGWGEWVGRGSVYAIDSTVTIGDELRPGRYGVGLFEMTNSTVTANNGTIGEKGGYGHPDMGGDECIGTVTVNSGSLTIATDLEVAQEASSLGYINMYGGEVKIGTVLHMAMAVDSEAYVNLHAGSMLRTVALDMQAGGAATSIIKISPGAALVIDEIGRAHV